MDSYFFIIPSQPGFFEFKLLKDFEAIRELNFQIHTSSNFQIILFSNLQINTSSNYHVFKLPHFQIILRFMQMKILFHKPQIHHHQHNNYCCKIQIMI